MKPLSLLITVFYIANVSLAQVGGDFFQNDTVKAGATVNMIGEEVVVCDEVAWTTVIDTMDGQPALIKLSDHDNGLTLVIWKEDHDMFSQPLEQAFNPGQHVCVGGWLEDFKGTVRLEIGYRDQVHFRE